MKTPNQRELWRDALADATPDTFAEASLAFTLTHVRRARRARHAIRITGGAIVTIMAALFGALLVRSPHMRAPSHSSPEVIARVSEPKGIPVHYLTDEELLARFPGQPVALVGSGSSCEFIALEDLSRE